MVMAPGISFSELLAWIGSETRRYERWFAAQPAGAWADPVGSGRITTIRELLHHVYAADLRLAQRIQAQPPAADGEIAAADPAALFALARRGQPQQAAALASGMDLDAVISWQATAGHQLRASKRTVMAHSISHHLRHMAQAATLLRLHGYATDWAHDLLLSDALS
jgi:uncharacterized damage-inducible protein DinB